MKKLMLRVTVILVVLVVLAAPIFAIDVYMNGKKMEFDVEPMIIDGRTMVPMRAIFEKLGAEVTWDADTRSITADGGNDLNVKLAIGSNTMYINGKAAEIDVAPVINGGRTLVPLRAVSEAFGVKVVWDGDIQAVGMTSDGSKPLIPGLLYDNYLITSLDQNNYFKLVIRGNRVYYEGMLSYYDANYINVYVIPHILSDTEELYIENEIVHDGNSGYHKFQSDKSFSGYFDINGNRSYKVYIDVRSNDSENEDLYIFNSIYDGVINIERVNGKLVFKKSDAVENNYEVYNSLLAPEYYLSKAQLSQEEYTAIRKLSDEICKGLTTDYEKVRAMHDWIARHVYYNFDYKDLGGGEQEGFNVDTSALIILHRFTQCWGMSILLTDMCRIQGIPATKVVGPIRHNAMTDQFDVDTNNHAWNVVFVNGKWMVVDSTWDNKNELRDGIFKSLAPVSEYFNMELDVLSNDHRFDYFREGHDWYGDPLEPIIDDFYHNYGEPVGFVYELAA